MNTLFLAWQDPQSRTWYPVGKLTQAKGLYHFTYLQGALTAHTKAGFTPIVSFPDFNHTYSSASLFPLFANRLLQKNRPDYPDFLQWLNLPNSNPDPIALLGRSGGKRKTDNFEVFPYPERDSSGNYQIHFFSRGLRYLPLENQHFIQTLQPGAPLLLLHDLQNPVDPRALLLRTENRHLAGYCPHYLTQDLFELICQTPQNISVTVERINPAPTPLQFRLLCQLIAPWPPTFDPFSAPIYSPIVPEPAPLLT